MTADHRSLPMFDGTVERDPRFLVSPGLLIVRLMSRCNNKCRFCMVDEEIDTSADVPFDDAIAAITAQPVTSRIEFFGGEPTIHPRFLELLEFARARGHECSIATHGRTFASRAFLQKVERLGAPHIYVRTSLYGDTPALHDFFTRVPESYRQTVRGISNLVRSGFRCQVNLVIMADNLGRLEAMTRAVHEWGVPRIKFSNLIDVAHCESQAISLTEVTPHLTRAIQVAEELGLYVTVEKTPICVAGARIDLMSTERLIGQWERRFDDEGTCRGCLVRRWCEGVDPGYQALLGFAGLQTLSTVPARAVPHHLDTPREPEFLRIHSVRLDDQAVNEELELRVSALAERVERRLGLLAIFPERFIAA